MPPQTRSGRKLRALRSVSPPRRASTDITHKTREPSFEMKFDRFPKYLREGPWSYVVYIYLVAVVSSLVHVYARTDLLVVFPEEQTSLLSETTNPRLVSFGCATFMTSVLIWMFRAIGAWPLMSYTMVSWVLLTSRHALRALDAPTFVREILRFPALVGAWTTTLVWWLILTPLIYYILPTAHEKRGFVKFNTSPFLISIHLLNFPLCLLDHALSPRQLVATDLWIGMVVGMAYILFYLLVLDANGIHFYIIFSPRTPLFAVSASFILGLYWAIWSGFT